MTCIRRPPSRRRRTRPGRRRSPRLRIEGSRQRSCQALSVDGRTGQPLRREPQPEGRAGPQARSGVEAAGRPALPPHRCRRPQRRAWAAGAAVGRQPALLGSLRATPLARVRAGPGAGVGGAQPRRGVTAPLSAMSDFGPAAPPLAGRSQAEPGASVGWAQPNRPVYAPLSTTWLRTPPGPPRTIAADRAARCRAEPDRRGRVGVAHATRKCALVHNISQAWASDPLTWPIIQGLGNTPRPGPDRGPSLGLAQWPSCVTTLATSLSCPRSSSRRSSWPSWRTLARSSGRTSRFDEHSQPPVARRGARGRQHGAVDSDVQTRPRRLGEVRPSILLSLPAFPTAWQRPANMQRKTATALGSEHDPRACWRSQSTEATPPYL